MLRAGYEVLPALFTPDEIGCLRQAIADSIDRVARVMLTPFETSLPSVPLEEWLERVARNDRAYASALLQVVMADAQRDARLGAVASHPSLAAAIGAVLAPDVAIGHIVRIRAAIPAFASRISRWHQDVLRSEAATGCATVRVACWIPLSDVDEHSGTRSPSGHVGGALSARSGPRWPLRDSGGSPSPRRTARCRHPRGRRVAARPVHSASRVPDTRTAGALVRGHVGEGWERPIGMLRAAPLAWLPVAAVVTVVFAVALGPRGGRRVSKGNARVEAYGTIDELIAQIGLARALCAHDEAASIATVVQRDLFMVADALATDQDPPRAVDSGRTNDITSHGHRIESQDGILIDWALPGGHAGAAAFDVARTVCRGAERLIVRLRDAGERIDPSVITYLNRSSDLLWLLGRLVERDRGVDSALRRPDDAGARWSKAWP